MNQAVIQLSQNPKLNLNLSQGLLISILTLQRNFHICLWVPTSLPL